MLFTKKWKGQKFAKYLFKAHKNYMMWLLQLNTYEITYISAGEKLRSLSRNLYDKKNINLDTFQIAAIIAGIIYMDNNTYIWCPILRCDYTLFLFFRLTQ